MNPFSTRYTPGYFCDREKEIQYLRDNLVNGLNTLIHSPRRLGKTALVHHLFHQLGKEKQFETIYIDLFATQNMNDLIKILSEQILKKYHKRNIVEGLKKILSGLSPTISILPDGTPQIGLNLTESQYDGTLRQLFDFVNKRKKRVIIAFDEFQEVASYPEKAEAILRTHIQALSNIGFIFSGSSNHILQQMFYSAKRPFYQSSEVLVLEKIEHGRYFEFIGMLFEKSGKTITDEAIDYILDFSEDYTYYTQVICNYVFYRSGKKVSKIDLMDMTSNYLENRKLDYMNILSLLPENQKKVLIAIAKEGRVDKPTAMDFIIRYRLPSVSSTLQAVNALADKEVIYKWTGNFVVYDVFFRRFLEKYF